MRRRKGNLAEVIQTDVVGSMPLKTLAKVLQSKGRRGDTILAHITPKEAKKLKKAGGAGTTNPETGLPEFYEEGIPIYDYGFVPDVSVQEPVAQYQGPTYSDEMVQGYNPVSYDQTISTELPSVATPSLFDQAVAPYSFYNAPSVAGMPAVGYDYGTSQFAATSPQGVTVPPSDIQAQIAAAGGGIKPETDIGAPATKAADATGKTEEEKSTLEKLLTGKSALGLGILGAGGLMGYMNQQRAAEQAKNAAAQIQAAYQQAATQQKELAQPLIGPGYTQLSQALQGALSPANTQAFQAAQARAAQASARSGGVGAVQTALQEEALRQQLLASQQQQALNLIAPGNAMIQAAINAQLQGTTQSLGTRLQLEQAANQAAMNLYSSLGTAIGGGLLKG